VLVVDITERISDWRFVEKLAGECETGKKQSLKASQCAFCYLFLMRVRADKRGGHP
jgi:hypothetical protein